MGKTFWRESEASIFEGASARAAINSMSSDDMYRFLLSFVGILVVGTIFLILLFRYLSLKYPPPPVVAPQAGGAKDDENSPMTGAAGERRLGGAAAGDFSKMKKPTPKGAAPTGGGPQQAPTNIPRAKRNIPPAAASAMVDRGHRLREEKNFGESLKCYLSLLFAAVEHGGANAESLPVHLTDCLRGAAECYKGLNDFDNAVKFLQAERMIYEEMVAQEQKQKKGVEGSAQILSSLFGGKDISANAPRRAEVLTEVAEAAAKQGHDEIGLSYRVKAAAVKQKIEGKPLDPESPEWSAIAEAMDGIEKKKIEKELAEESAAAGRAPDQPNNGTASTSTTGAATAGSNDDGDVMTSTANQRREQKQQAEGGGSNVRRRKNAGKRKDGGDADVE